MSSAVLNNSSMPTIMGILNVTDNSFYQGGMFTQIDLAYDHAMRLVEEGVDIIDIGGESTNPFEPKKVSLQEELDRVVPLIEKIRGSTDTLISIDTSKPEVMMSAVASGANMINDVRALTVDGAVEAAAKTEVPVCLMHMHGEPETMQISPSYVNVVQEVGDYLIERANICQKNGIPADKIILDPGFCFGKSHEHNVEMFHGLHRFKNLGYPVLVGLSRKSMLGNILDAPPKDRLYGSIAVAIMLAQKGIDILRVHDVKETRDALKVLQALSCLQEELV